MKDSSTDSSGRRSRGKAVLRMSFPPPTTERAPRETEVLTSRKAKRLSIRWARKIDPRPPPRMM